MFKCYESNIQNNKNQRNSSMCSLNKAHFDPCIGVRLVEIQVTCASDGVDKGAKTNKTTHNPQSIGR